MSQAYPYDQFGEPIAIRATESARAAFIRRTYTHLAGAVLAFVALECLIFKVLLPDAASVQSLPLFNSPWSLLILLGVFIGVGMLARWWAYNGANPAMAYTGLALYVILEAIIFIPILSVIIYFLPPGVSSADLLGQAGVMTLALFGGLTMIAVTTRKDFSFLGPILCTAGFLMIGLCIGGVLFGFTPGLWFSFLGVGLASGFILYDTSNVLHHFRTDQHVAAALELFASVAYLFWHILRILLILASNRD